MAGALLQTLLILWAATCLVWAVSADLRERRIPNGAVLALALGAFAQMALEACGVQLLSALPEAGERLASCCILLLGCSAFELVWRAAHGGAHGVGMGDIKLLGACALWVGSGVLLVFGLACMTALCVELLRRRSAFAFGPYIACGFGACLLVLLQPWATCLYVLE